MFHVTQNRWVMTTLNKIFHLFCHQVAFQSLTGPTIMCMLILQADVWTSLYFSSSYRPHLKSSRPAPTEDGASVSKSAKSKKFNLAYSIRFDSVGGWACNVDWVCTTLTVGMHATLTVGVHATLTGCACNIDCGCACNVTVGVHVTLTVGVHATLTGCACNVTVGVHVMWLGVHVTLTGCARNIDYEFVMK